jgi:hypothetical protein
VLIHLYLTEAGLMFKASLRRAIAWIAISAILFSACAPTLAQAFDNQQSKQPWASICTASGTKLVLLDHAEHDTQGLDHAEKHCGWCFSQSVMPAVMPLVVALHSPALELHPKYPSPHIALPTQIWASAQPRAPPLS